MRSRSATGVSDVACVPISARTGRFQMNHLPVPVEPNEQQLSLLGEDAEVKKVTNRAVVCDMCSSLSSGNPRVFTPVHTRPRSGSMPEGSFSSRRKSPASAVTGSWPLDSRSLTQAVAFAHDGCPRHRIRRVCHLRLRPLRSVGREPSRPCFWARRNGNDGLSPGCYRPVGSTDLEDRQCTVLAQGHIWIGLLSVAFILFHAGFRWVVRSRSDCG
ncbi:MAG: hypothetical protein Ct9H300mP1_26050 [Planctomycetaceae bacterium]|nr:MAG: hypothetical protein Ct9H300mP1_26050 [Planctomycetaceae bacterium]